MIIGPSTISNLVLVSAGFGGAFAVALWVSLIIWTFRDIRSRSRDPLAVLLAVCLSVVLFLPGVLIYLILRPPRTIDDEYRRALEEETNLAALDEAGQCPGCSRHVQPGWLICPTCRTRLKKNCRACGKQMEIGWDICPYCGTPETGFQTAGDNRTASASR